MRDFIRFTVAVTLSSSALAQGVAEPADPSQNPLSEVVVRGEQAQDPTHISEAAQKLIDVPGALGDPVAAVFSLPGVVSAGGDGGEPAVRGSSPNDNLYLVDFLPAGYVFHTFTNSVFSENVLQDFQLLPAGFGPQFGNVTGAVFDIALRKPRHQPLKTILDVSMLRSGVFVEGAMTEHSAAYLSVRKSLIHLFIPKDKESNGVTLKQAPQDDDYQFKYAWDITPDQTLTWAATGASDLAEADFGTTSDAAQQGPDLAGDARLKNRFANQSVVWNYAPEGGPRFKLGAAHMKQDMITRWGEGYFNDVGLDQWLMKLQYDQPLADRHTLHLGGEIARNEHSLSYAQVLYVCSEFDPTCGNVRRGYVSDDEGIREISREAFLADTWRLTDTVMLDFGAQYQTNTYTREHFVNPRGAFEWGFASRWWLTAKAGQYNRFPDLQTVLPKLGNPELKSPTAKHFSLGLRHELEGGWSWSAEGYYKHLDDLPLALDPSQPDASRLYSNDERGRAYGLELLLNRELTDRWYGWLAVSLAKSERIDERTRQTQDYRLDTPFLLTWVMNYQISPRLDGGLRFTVHSGQATTPIVGIQPNPDFEGYVQPEYGQPFSERLPLYSRLDLRIKRAVRVGRYDGAVILDIINALNIHNIQGHNLDYRRSRDEGRVVLRDSTGYGLFPALTFRIAF